MGKLVPRSSSLFLFPSHQFTRRRPIFYNHKILNSSAYSTGSEKYKGQGVLVEGSPMVTCLNFKKNAPVGN